MDFGLSDEQTLLQQSAREFLTQECSPAFVRTVIGDGDGFPRALYQKMASLGWHGLVVPESFGGSGLSLLDLALLAEEMGRVTLPGPFFSSAVLATYAIMLGGSAAHKKSWLSRLASGDVVGTVALLEPSDRLDSAGVAAKAKKTRTGYRLTGTKAFVTDAHVADVIITVCRTSGKGDDGISLFLVPREAPGVTIHPLENHDRTRRFADVELADVDVPATALLGREGKGWAVVKKILDIACTVIAADSLGGAEKSLELAVEYAKIRQQFGRVIGSFQAVKHIAAEMVSEIEPARSLLWYAAYAYDALPKDAARAAAMAKARLSDIYSRTTNRSVQIHGGIGFTWEHDMHLWFKRAKWNELAFGDPSYHRERVAQLSGL